LTDDFSGDLSKWVNTTNATITSGQLTLTNNELMRSVSGGTGWTLVAIWWTPPRIPPLAAAKQDFASTTRKPHCLTMW
jgi:hypothetical protein